MVTVDVVVGEAVVMVVDVVMVAVDVVVRIVIDVTENVWLLSLGVTALFGMLITLFMVDDSDQELETLLLACHIPCYVYLFFKTLNLSNKENNPCLVQESETEPATLAEGKPLTNTGSPYAAIKAETGSLRIWIRCKSSLGTVLSVQEVT